MAAKKLSKKHAVFGDAIRAQCKDLPLGPTLTALIALEPVTDALAVEANEIDQHLQARLLSDHGIVAIGRTPNGYFGPLAGALAKTIDASPIGYADRQGLDPEVAGADLASFLSILAYAPDFFELHVRSAEDWQKAHAESAAVGDALFEKLSVVPGVKRVTTGAEIVRLLAVAPRHAFAARAGSKVDFAERAEQLFEAHVGTSNLLIDLESVEIDEDADDALVIIGVNAADELMKKIVPHRAVDKPVGTFISALRAAYPEKEVQLKFEAVPLGHGAEARRSLIFALKHAKATDLLSELGLA